MDYYKPLTPEYRDQILSSINDAISEINTCKDTYYKELYLSSYRALKTIINSLPDGYPIPINYKRNIGGF
jgi:hypothetical protein